MKILIGSIIFVLFIVSEHGVLSGKNSSLNENSTFSTGKTITPEFNISVTTIDTSTESEIDFSVANLSSNFNLPPNITSSTVSSTTSNSSNNTQPANEKDINHIPVISRPDGTKLNVTLTTSSAIINQTNIINSVTSTTKTVITSEGTENPIETSTEVFSWKPPSDFYEDHYSDEDYDYPDVTGKKGEEFSKTPESSSKQDIQGFYSNFQKTNPDDGSSYFLTYFVYTCFICVIGYLLFHNKKKIIAFVVEGRRSNNGRRRPSSSSYTKLDSKLDDVLTGEQNTTSKSTVFY